MIFNPQRVYFAPITRQNRLHFVCQPVSSAIILGTNVPFATVTIE